jgi:hypothetical protein
VQRMVARKRGPSEVRHSGDRALRASAGAFACASMRTKAESELFRLGGSGHRS